VSHLLIGGGAFPGNIRRNPHGFVERPDLVAVGQCIPSIDIISEKILDGLVDA
jgi:hypothetical protein